VTRSIAARRLRRPLAAALLAATLAAGILPGPGLVGTASPAVRLAAAPEPVVGSTAVDAGAAVDATTVAQPNGEPALALLTAAPPAPTPDAPSTAYEETLAHANDRIDFTPGGRVTVGFTPRSTDTWSVGGQAPVALPAGRTTGKAMATSSPRPVPTPGGPLSGAITPGSYAPLDAPSVVLPALAAQLSFVSPTPDPAVASDAASGLRREVFGFLPYWQLPGAATSLNYGVLTTIAYFSVGADASGNLTRRNSDGTLTTGWAGWTSSSMTSVINAAHAHGTRVVLTGSVFAWNTGGAAIQRALLGSAAARANYARQLVAAVRDRGADGVNLDFEPLVSGQEANFVALLRTLRSQLNAVRRGYQITFDTTGSIGNYPLEASVGPSAADAVFVMGYDYRTAGSSTSGSVDPLSGPTYDLADTVREYTARISPSRVILGVPWDGRAWSTATSSPRSKNISGAQYGYSTAVDYGIMPALVKQYGRRWDPVEQSPYIVYRRQNCTTAYGCVTSWRQVWYDDAASLAGRYQLVNDYGLRGAGLWALGYDGGYQELTRALSDAFLVDHSAPQAGITALPPAAPDEGIAVAWSATDVSAVRSYDVQVSVDGGAWTPWVTRTTATTNVWLGADGHGYAFRVRATDAKGNVGSWNVTAADASTPAGLAVGGFGRVTLAGLAYRTGPDASAAKLGSLPAGTIVALTSGPVSADGYTWYEVTQPVREWAPVSFVERGVWIAVASSSATFVAPYHSPNTTVVDAGITGFDFGGGGLTGPSAAAVAGRSFSPNDDGSQDGLGIRWTATVALDHLMLNVLRLDGSLVGSVPVVPLTTGTHAFTWDGTVGGQPVPDGRYLLQLTGTAGTRTYHAPSALPATPAQVAMFAVTVDTVAPVVTSASASSSLISPNGDRIRDTASFALASKGAALWTVRIAADGADPVRTASGPGGAIKFTWNGRGDSGAPVPDGAYVVTLAACDVAGNCATKTYPVRVDTTPPVVAPSAAPGAFSPDGDGSGDTAHLLWASSETVSGTVAVWRGSTLVRRWPISRATSGVVAWNGRTASGTLVSDGRYTVRMDVRDAAGNRQVSSAGITVDRTAGFLRWSDNFFAQDGDRLAATSSLSWRLTRAASTTLALYDASGSVVRTVWTNRSQAAGTRTWTWDGRLADGTYAPQGAYTAQLTIASPYGTQTLTRTVWAAAFPASMSPAAVQAGGVLTVRFSTAEPLKSVPKVTLYQPGLTPQTMTATRLANGSFQARFTVLAGATGPATIRILGKDTAGHANTSWYTVAVAP
jgi:spore germination protein YaaH/flagellar hook assembly protein FlgD